VGHFEFADSKSGGDCHRAHEGIRLLHAEEERRGLAMVRWEVERLRFRPAPCRFIKPPPRGVLASVVDEDRLIGLPERVTFSTSNGATFSSSLKKGTTTEIFALTAQTSRLDSRPVGCAADLSEAL
jgi:hypothetical protein